MTSRDEPNALPGQLRTCRTGTDRARTGASVRDATEKNGTPPSTPATETAARGAPDTGTTQTLSASPTATATVESAGTSTVEIFAPSPVPNRAWTVAGVEPAVSSRRLVVPSSPGRRIPATPRRAGVAGVHAKSPIWSAVVARRSAHAAATSG